MAAHVARRYMAGIDRREPGSEQGDEGWLWPRQVERHLPIAAGGHLREVSVPSLAGIDAKLLRCLAGQQVPGALDVLRSKWLSIVPFDAFAQPKRQLGFVLVPGPVGGEVGHDRLRTGLRNVLLVHDEVVEDPHHRPLSRASPPRGSTCSPGCPNGR